MDDTRIIELYFERSEDAIKETEAKYGRLCSRIAKNILGTNEDTEECVNDTYLSLWNTIPPQHPENLTAFISRIVRNLAFKKHEYNSAKKRSSVHLVSLSELEEILPDAHIGAGTSDEDIGRAISSFLLGEKETARDVFIRKYWFFDSVADIAERYSFSESKVKSMLFQTRLKLKIYLKKEGIYV